MSYVDQDDLKGFVPNEYLVGAMDDDNDASADTGIWDAIAEAVDDDINALLASRYSTPISPTPPQVKSAARVLAAVLLYRRRGVPDSANPWIEEANARRERLAAIGRGEADLSPGFDSTETPVTITEPARTFDRAGRLMA